MEFGEPGPDSNGELFREIRTIHASFLHSRIAVRIPKKPIKIDPFSAYPAPADRVDNRIHELKPDYEESERQVVRILI